MLETRHCAFESRLFAGKADSPGGECDHQLPLSLCLPARYHPKMHGAAGYSRFYGICAAGGGLYAGRRGGTRFDRFWTDEMIAPACKMQIFRFAAKVAAGRFFWLPNYAVWIRAQQKLPRAWRVFVRQLNRPMGTITGRFLCDALTRQRLRLPCAKGAVSEAD